MNNFVSKSFLTHNQSVSRWKNSLPLNIIVYFLCDFDRASSLICGNKMPTRCNRWFLLQILLLVQHVSGYHYAHHQELESIIQVVAACGIWCFGFQVVGMVWSWGLCDLFAGCSSPQTGHITLTWKPKHQLPQAATTCIILSSSWWWA
jgi:hypothetical protein